MAKIYLNKDWLLRWEELAHGPEKNALVLQKADGWLKTDLPCDVHMPLIAADMIKEPLESDHYHQSEWIEEKSWWFKKVFHSSEDFIKGDVIEITLESLDAEADVFLNGIHLGHQKSAFYPFIMDVKEYLRAGENILLVRLSSGLEYYSDADLGSIKKFVCTENIRGYMDRGDARRAFVRKPQYVYGWDWGPRIPTCGIVKNVWLESMTKHAVRSVQVVTDSISKDGAILKVAIEVENFDQFATMEGIFQFEMAFAGNSVVKVEQENLLRSGLNKIDFTVNIAAPKLWWPNGMGEPNLYTVKTQVMAGGVTSTYSEFQYGIRIIKLDLTKLNNKERKFAIEINGVTALCKGGNWIPADSIYARVSDEKYQTLLLEAKEANFNMMRLWGGGFYEQEIFYEKCDQYGIMIWHDLMFACALYPDYLEWFRNEVEKELDYQTRHLRNHASMALWCGCNENHWGFNDWWGGEPGFFGGAECYNKIAPKIIYRNCPEIPYWNCSPYGGDDPNGNDIGDRHHWRECTMGEDMEKRITPEEYDKISAKFITEYGCIGPDCKSSTLKYMAGAPLDRNSAIWKHHSNAFEKDTVIASIAKHYLDPQNLSFDDFLLYGCLCHGLMLGYSLEAIRFKENCWGSLFWMYDDCWGEVGWTIIDYYLKRKPSYYFVKRAFAHLKLIMRESGGKVRVVGINDTTMPFEFRLEYGYVSFDGGKKDSQCCQIELAAFSRSTLLEFAKQDYDCTRGAIFAQPVDNKAIASAILRTHTFRELKLAAANLVIREFKQDETGVRFIIGTDHYAHAVHFNLGDDVKLSDEYFDLLPGEEKEILIDSLTINQKDLKPACIYLP
ncbi:MAG TPA: beta-mannosidase [Firmicutes bacterium]|jgi:beta-mannosidase|nr:beta-mannosidase [Bacillota bacterium]